MEDRKKVIRIPISEIWLPGVSDAAYESAGLINRGPVEQTKEENDDE